MFLSRKYRLGVVVSFLEKISKLKVEFEKELSSAQSFDHLQRVRSSFLGKNGAIADLVKCIKGLDAKERPVFGKALNELKNFCEELFEKNEKLFRIKQAEIQNELDRNLDVTAVLPGDRVEGNLHVYTKFIERIEEIFISMGFQIFDGPEVETDFYNFGALNIPEDHPARDMYDTFWLDLPGHLLRTHTSSVQIRAMQKHGVPIAGIAPGRVFRHEATDATHEIVFSQCEGLFVDKNVSISNLLGVAKTFLSEFFETKNLEIRTRPGFFPFVEPGVEIDVKCVFCKGGCSVCKKTTWIEVFPGGLIHPNVFKAVGVDSNIFSGFAFGFGVDRMAMLLHSINDIRLFRSGDIRFIRQF